ncbi:MAG: NHL repeat-containing protein [Oscillospiraceae bacterium]|jgi:DNA-binding beta-propeller fold protein YncE|nr:NHL repeat-containing protein [Oscillospiraceae bacterium]
MRKKLPFLLCAVPLLFSAVAAPARAALDVPYDSYIYNYRGYIEFTPAPYVPTGTISGITLGVGAFANPQGMCVSPDGYVYVADSGNNRVVKISPDFTQAEVIDTFINNGEPDSFSRPFGVTVSEKNLLYVADTENRRVVVLNKDGALVQIVQNPRSEMLPDDYAFVPLKLAVDYADRVYVIARNMFQGIMVFTEEGEFTGFFGTISVKITLWQRFWRLFSTVEQRQSLFIATEFTGVDVDPMGFVYASFIDTDGVQAAFRLNPKGEDVIKRGENGNLGGDISVQYGRPSRMVDIIERGKGVYSMLDAERGRVFTYDNEGNMLYIFGGLGSQVGTFRQPVAIEDTGSGAFLALDADRQEIMVFSETEYGRLINLAVGMRYDGDEEEAVGVWEQVLTLNENLELANIGIGKAYLTAGDNAEAMKHLKLGMNRTYYSIAFKRYRNDFLKANLGYMLTAVILLLVCRFVWNRIINRGKKKGKGNLLADG